MIRAIVRKMVYYQLCDKIQGNSADGTDEFRLPREITLRHSETRVGRNGAVIVLAREQTRRERRPNSGAVPVIGREDERKCEFWVFEREHRTNSKFGIITHSYPCRRNSGSYSFSKRSRHSKLYCGCSQIGATRRRSRQMPIAASISAAGLRRRAKEQ